jgi:hypothetical protein
MPNYIYLIFIYCFSFSFLSDVWFTLCGTLVVLRCMVSFLGYLDRQRWLMDIS